MRTCLNCGSKTTRIHNTAKGTPYEHWAKYKDGFLCFKCHAKLINGPKQKSKLLRWTPMGKQIILKENPRKGICSLCGKQGRTGMHHLQYHKDDPLKDTVELCVPCHNKQHIRQRDLKGRYI